MAKIVLIKDASIYELADQKSASAAAKKQNLKIVRDVATIEKGTIVEVGSPLSVYDDSLAKAAVQVYPILEDIPDVANKGEFVTGASSYVQPYNPPKAGALGAPRTLQVKTDLNVRALPSSAKGVKVLKKISKGKIVKDLQDVAGTDPPWLYSKSLGGYVALADNKQTFWEIPGESKPSTGSSTADKGPSDITWVERTPASGLSTPTILAIAGGVVLLLLLATTPSGGRRTARA